MPNKTKRQQNTCQHLFRPELHGLCPIRVPPRYTLYQKLAEQQIYRKLILLLRWSGELFLHIEERVPRLQFLAEVV